MLGSVDARNYLIGPMQTTFVGDTLQSSFDRSLDRYYGLV